MSLNLSLQSNPVQSQNINGNLNLDNQKYKEKGKELGLFFEEPKLKPLLINSKARRNFIEAWKEEGKWKVKGKCEENESGMVEEMEKVRELGFWGAPNHQNFGF